MEGSCRGMNWSDGGGLKWHGKKEFESRARGEGRGVIELSERIYNPVRPARQVFECSPSNARSRGGSAWICIHSRLPCPQLPGTYPDTISLLSSFCSHRHPPRKSSYSTTRPRRPEVTHPRHLPTTSISPSPSSPSISSTSIVVPAPSNTQTTLRPTLPFTASDTDPFLHSHSRRHFVIGSGLHGS